MSEEINLAGALGFVFSVLSPSVGRVGMQALHGLRRANPQGKRGPGHFPIPPYVPQTKALVHWEPGGGEGMSESFIPQIIIHATINCKLII